MKPSVIIIAEQLKLFPQEFYDNGLSVVSVASRRNTPDALDPRIKSMNYLNNVLVKIEAKTSRSVRGSYVKSTRICL